MLVGNKIGYFSLRLSRRGFVLLLLPRPITGRIKYWNQRNSLKLWSALFTNAQLENVQKDMFGWPPFDAELQLFVVRNHLRSLGAPIFFLHPLWVTAKYRHSPKMGKQLCSSMNFAYWYQYEQATVCLCFENVCNCWIPILREHEKMDDGWI